MRMVLVRMVLVNGTSENDTSDVSILVRMILVNGTSEWY